MKITIEKNLNFISQLKKHGQGRCLMICPKKFQNLIIKILIIIRPIARVNDKIMVIMSLMKEFNNIFNRIPISLLYSCCRKCHSNNSICNICKVKIILILYSSIFWSCDNPSQYIEHYFLLC